MAQSEYTINIPKNNMENYIDHILTKIFRIYKRDLPQPIGEKKSSVNIRLYKETNTEYIIRFDCVGKYPLINILPKIEVVSQDLFYENQEVFSIVKSHLSLCDGGCYNMRPSEMKLYTEFQLSNDDLKNLVYCLAKDKKINSFFMLQNNRYLVLTCLYNLFGIRITREGKLRIKTLPQMLFDPEDGFFSLKSKYTKGLNKAFFKWEELGDITKPVLPDIVI